MKLDEARQFWKVAGSFPINKEEVYPGHAVAHEFDWQAGKSVLEYGCGGGSDTLSLLRRGAVVTFVDIVPENVATTKARIAAAFSRPIVRVRAEGFVLDESARIPRGNALFDTVTCHGVLHHIPEETMYEVIDEFYRVLKPGGHLYAMLYTETLFTNNLHRIERLVAEKGLSVEQAFGVCTDGGGIARAYSLDEGRTLFEDRGGFEFISELSYNNGDFRTFMVKKPGRPTS